MSPREDVQTLEKGKKESAKKSIFSPFVGKIEAFKMRIFAFPPLLAFAPLVGRPELCSEAAYSSSSFGLSSPPGTTTFVRPSESGHISLALFPPCIPILLLLPLLSCPVSFFILSPSLAISLLWSSSTLYPSSFSLCRSYPLSLFSFHTGH